MDLLDYAPALLLHSGNPITPLRTSAEERRGNEVSRTLLQHFL